MSGQMWTVAAAVEANAKARALMAQTRAEMNRRRAWGKARRHAERLAQLDQANGGRRGHA